MNRRDEPLKDPWNLIESGRFDEAVKAFTVGLRRDKSGPNYGGRGIAYLNLGEYDRAMADFQAADEAFPYTTDGYLQSVGVAQWLASRESEATNTWHDLVLAIERGKIQYTDGAGGVESACLLWFAAVRSSQKELLRPARRLLKNRVKAKSGRNWRIENWPGPIAKFLLGLLDESGLRKNIIDMPIAHDRQLCQAEFYIGVRTLQTGDWPGAKKAFRKAAGLHTAKVENEYYLAAHESKKRCGPRLTSH